MQISFVGKIFALDVNNLAFLVLKAVCGRKSEKTWGLEDAK
jgi:hypothetical protein